MYDIRFLIYISYRVSSPRAWFILVLVRPFERLPRNQLNNQRANAVNFLDGMNLRDVRMIQQHENLRFTLKSGKTLWGLAESRDFDRYFTIQLGIASGI